MKAAAPKTYISSRMMEQYKQRRTDKLAEKVISPPKHMVVKKFAEDEEEKKEEVQPAQMMAQSEGLDQAQDINKAVQYQAQDMDNAVQYQAYGMDNSVQNQAQDMNNAVEEVKSVQASKVLDKAAEEKPGFFKRLASSVFGSKKQTESSSVVRNRRASFERRASIERDIDRNLSCEEMDSDDLGGELNLSDQEDGMDERAFRREFKSKKRAGTKQKAQVYRQEFDTNVFEVALSCLADKGNMATGDAEICVKCQGVFNMTSVLKEVDGNQIWECEFCNNPNEVMIDAEEIPQAAEVTYLIEASAQVQDALAGGNASKDISVVFCCDISGSMCVSQPVAGKHKLKGDNLSALEAQMRQFGDGSDQFISASDKGMTYVSRIQCVKAAIDSQITDMANGAGERKVGVVTFNHEVQIIGDATKAQQTIGGDHLNNFEYLQNNGKAQATERLTQPINATQDKLKAKLDAIEETGPTALGPGILTAVAMAAEGSAGSSVVICTDGLANIGLGAFDECRTEADTTAAEQFYERIGQIASAAGVTINIVSIEGDECNLDSLSSLAELTGGKVERVNPTTLTQDFANMLSVPVIATNVDAKVKLHKGLQFRNELATDLSEDKSLLARRFGNATTETVFTFEYGMKPITQLLEMEDVDMSALTHFPFQTQIKYTALDGSKCLRVISKKMEVSGEREELNSKVDANLLQKNCVMKGTQMARAGNIREAQAIMKGFKRNAQKKLAPEMQSQMMNDFSEKVEDVYGQLGNAVDSAGEEELDQVMNMRQESACMARGSAMESSSMMMQSESMSAAPRRSKAASSTNKVGGKKKLNDQVSTKLYKLSKF